MPESLTFPIGRELFSWNPPAECKLSGPPLFPLWPRERISALISSIDESAATLKNIAAGKRRAVIVVGDFSLPAPYPILLPKLTKTLVAAGIRPSRITVLCAPGRFDKVLGAAATRRYGEESVGEFHLRPWDGDPLDPTYAQADLRLALFPLLPTSEAQLTRDLLRSDPALAPDWSLPSLFPENTPPNLHNFNADVYWVGGGGHPLDAVFEEALLGVELFLRRNPRAKPCASSTLVFCFSGAQGLGSAVFFQDLLSLLTELDECLAAGEDLVRENANDDQRRQRPEHFDPATTLAEALACFYVVLFSPNWSAHEDGETLKEHLSQLPAVGRRLRLVENQENLWSILREKHGQTWTLQTAPFVADMPIPSGECF